MKARIPSPAAPIAEPKTGLISQVWNLFFRDLIAPAQSAAGVVLTGSPFQFQASDDGYVLIAGGTVSAVDLIRGTTTIPTGLTAGFFPVSQGDILEITYAVGPTVTFIPSAGY